MRVCPVRSYVHIRSAYTWGEGARRPIKVLSRAKRCMRSRREGRGRFIYCILIQVLAQNMQHTAHNYLKINRCAHICNQLFYTILYEYLVIHKRSNYGYMALRITYTVLLFNVHQGKINIKGMKIDNLGIQNFKI